MSSRRSPHNRLIEIAPLALGAVLAVAVFAAASAVVAAPGASAERVASRPAVKRCVPGRPSADHGRSVGRRSDRECCPPGLGRDRRTGRAEPPGKPSCDGASTADDHAASSWEAIARLRADRRLLAELESSPPSPTAVPRDLDAEPACPNISWTTDQHPSAGQVQVLTAPEPPFRYALVEGDAVWSEQDCPLFTGDTFQDVSLFASVWIAGPDTLLRVSVSGPHATDVYYAPHFVTSLEGYHGDQVTGGVIAPTDQFLLDTNWCNWCTFDGTVYENADLTQPPAELQNAEFASVHFTNVDLTGANLSHAKFTADEDAPGSLRGVSFSGADLTAAAFDMGGEYGVLRDVDFSLANMGCATFRDLVIGQGTNFDGATWSSDCPQPHFSNVVMDIETLATIASSDALIDNSSVHVGDPTSTTALKQQDLRWLRFTNSNFVGYAPDLGAAFDQDGNITTRTNLSGATLDGSRFSSVNMQGANLGDASLSGTDFTGADLWQAIFTDASAPNADFTSARVWDATFTSATLTAASFAGSDAHGAQFGSVSAQRADFAGAYLFPGGREGATPVTFSQSDLSEADFSGALLGAVIFDGPATRLVGATFTGAQCISCNFTNAVMVAKGQGVDFQRSYLLGTTFSTSLNLANFTDATCCATIPPGQASLAWEFAAYVPTDQGIAGPNVLYGAEDLASSDLQGATCPSASVAGPSGCTGAQTRPTGPVGRLGCVSAYVYTCPPTISTLAGNGTKGFDPTDEFAHTSPLGDPASVVVTPSAVLFADPANHVVREVTNVNSPDPTIATVAGTGTAGTSGDGGPAAAAELSAPTGLAIRDSDAAIAVADRDGDVVRLIGPDGTISTVAGDGTPCADPTSTCGDGAAATAAQLNEPTTVWFAPNEDLYVADTGNHKIRVVDAETGLISTVAGDGTVCATTTVPACGDGAAATAAHLSSPTGGLIGDQQGNVYFSDTGIGRVRLIDPTGDVQSFTAEGDFQAPTGIAIDAIGNRYIVDQTTHAVYRINITGIPFPHLWAGTPGTSCPDPTPATGACGDGGAAADATFNSPAGLFVAPDAALSLWVADTFDQRIRHLAAPF